MSAKRRRKVKCTLLYHKLNFQKFQISYLGTALLDIFGYINELLLYCKILKLWSFGLIFFFILTDIPFFFIPDLPYQKTAKGTKVLPKHILKRKDLQDFFLSRVFMC